LIRDPAEEEVTRIAQHPGEVLMQLVVRNPVRVAAIAVSRNINRKHYLPHRPPPHMTFDERVTRRVIEFSIIENSGDLAA
jgi:hypothetical protein